jgi:hypothetical protein
MSFYDPNLEFLVGCKSQLYDNVYTIPMGRLIVKDKDTFGLDLENGLSKVNLIQLYIYEFIPGSSILTALLTPKGPGGHIVSSKNFITLITCLDFIILTQC